MKINLLRVGSFICLLNFIIVNSAFAQNDSKTKSQSTDDPMAVELTKQLSNDRGYIWPKDPKVQENLNKWQGYKFGLLIHMGLYSELGIVE